MFKESLGNFIKFQMIEMHFAQEIFMSKISTVIKLHAKQLIH